jgi:hypothetical protein
MAVKIEPFSFLSIILKLLNLPDDVNTGTIFSYTGEYIPETKTKTHKISKLLYPILDKQQSISGKFMDLLDFLKQFGLTKIITDPKFDIQTKEAQTMIEKFSKLIECKLIFYILDATKVINCIIFNKDSQNSKIITYANKQYILYVDQTQIPETIIKKIILYETQIIKQQEQQKKQQEKDAKIAQQLQESEKKEYEEFIAGQQKALEQYKAPKPAPKPAPKQTVSEGASVVPPKQVSKPASIKAPIQLVSEGARAVPERAMAYEAPEQPIAGWGCNKCTYINKYSYQTCQLCGEVKINPIDKSLLGDNIIYIFENNGSKEGFSNHCMLISILMFLNKNGYPGLTLQGLRTSVIINSIEWGIKTEYDERNIAQKEILKK